MSLALGCYSYHDCDQNYSRPLHDSLKAYISGAVFRPQDLEPVVASAFASHIVEQLGARLGSRKDKYSILSYGNVPGMASLRQASPRVPMVCWFPASVVHDQGAGKGEGHDDGWKHLQAHQALDAHVLCICDR